MDSVRGNNFRNSLRYDVTPRNHPEQSRNPNSDRNNHQRRDMRNQPNSQKRDIRNRPNTYNKKYTRNKKIALAIGTLAAVLAIGGGIKLHNNNLNDIYANNIQSNIEVKMVEKIKEELQPHHLSFDGDNFNTSFACDRPELYGVLSSTDLDELLNEYLANPTRANKEQLLNDLQGREGELAKLNFELIKASFADSLNCSMEDIRIIINPTQNGRTLNIYTPEVDVQQWSKQDKVNNEQIPAPYSNIIADTAILLVDTEGKSVISTLTTENLIESYKNIKPIINEYNFTIENETVCLKKADKTDDKTYDYTEKLCRHPKITEQEEREE